MLKIKRWKHFKVVEYFLEKCKFDKKILRRSYKLTSNKKIKEQIKKLLKS